MTTKSVLIKKLFIPTWKQVKNRFSPRKLSSFRIESGGFHFEVSLIVEFIRD